jgi:hypothetical protein
MTLRATFQALLSRFWFGVAIAGGYFFAVILAVDWIDGDWPPTLRSLVIRAVCSFGFGLFVAFWLRRIRQRVAARS